MKIQYFSIGLFLILSFMCSTGQSAGDPQTMVQNNNRFAINLYRFLSNSEKNIVFSPYSISTAVAMTYAGARSQTEKEMAEVMHFIPDQEKLHAAFFGLQNHMKTVQKRGNVKLTIANSLWLQKGLTFLDSFLDLNKKYYTAAMNFVDYFKDSEGSRRRINRWVEKKTEKKIRDLIPPGGITADARLVLCNAIYFKGLWENKFKKESTHNGDFYLSDESKIKTPMMVQRELFRMKQIDDFTAIELPYVGDDVSMVILLPDAVSGLQKLEDRLTQEKVDQWMDELIQTKRAEIDLYLPKFKVISDFTLKENLIQMGMISAFDWKKADFSGMTREDKLFIGQAIHKAFVAVDEEGTEAAAATAITMEAGAAFEDPPPVVRIDHPFLFFIREKETGSILFMGRIVDPGKRSDQ